MTTAAENLKRQREARIDCACLQVAFVVAQSLRVIRANTHNPRPADLAAYERVEKRLEDCRKHIQGRENSTAYQRRLAAGWSRAKDVIMSVQAKDEHTEAVAIIDAASGLAQAIANCIPRADKARRRAWERLSAALASLYDRLVKPLKVVGVGDVSMPLLAGLVEAMAGDLEVAA